jgi:DNA polymerase III subunit delta'
VLSDTASTSTSPLELLRRSLDRGRLGHAYLFFGDDLTGLESHALHFLNWVFEKPGNHPSSDPRIDQRQHPDILWIRPESKSRQISIEQTRELIRTLSLRPMEARFKAAVIVAADRMNRSGANAFLKTLEEPPSGSLLLLLSTEPDQLLETIQSRCLRLNFVTGSPAIPRPVQEWLSTFARKTSADTSRLSLVARYQLLGTLLAALAVVRERLTEEFLQASPLTRYPDATSEQKEQWEDELKAAVESEYRRHRLDYIAALHGWLRDVWIFGINPSTEGLIYPALAPDTEVVSRRLDPELARKNLDVWEKTQSILYTNVQESLALEVGLLRLNL